VIWSWRRRCVSPNRCYYVPTVPNAVTFFRLILLPVVVASVLTGQLVIGVIAGLLMGASDFFDGYLARKGRSETRVGSVADKIVDRAVIISALAALVVKTWIPLWILTIVVARDFALLVFSLTTGRRASGRASLIGKSATGCMLAFFPIYLAARLLACHPMYALALVLGTLGVGLSVYSALEGMLTGRYTAHPRDEPGRLGCACPVRFCLKNH